MKNVSALDRRPQLAAPERFKHGEEAGERTRRRSMSLGVTAVTASDPVPV
jgi:hypothetical protein